MHAKLLVAAALLLPRLLLACEPTPEGSSFDGLCGLVSGRCTDGPRIAVLSAFPYEQHLLRQTVQVTETLDFQGRSLLLGRLGGQRVLLRLTGIGLENARLTTEALLAQFDLSAIVFAGVAGSQQRIGDVMIPATWTDIASGQTFDVDPGFLQAAERVAASNPTLSHCTPHPLEPPGPDLCLGFTPTVVVGGAGTSSDPYQGGVFPCLPNIPNNRDIFGCEAQSIAVPQGQNPSVDAVDMETAAVAAVAAAHGVPFIAVRAASDGMGDPLGGSATSFEQFFVYYRLASDNEAVVTTKLLAELPGAEKVKGHRRTPRSRAAATCEFERAAAFECEGLSASRRVARLVSAACALRAKVIAGKPHADRLASRAAARWQRAATLVGRGKLPSCCAEGIARRLQAAAVAVSTDVQSRLPF